MVNQRALSICLASAELAPLAKTGGLADVCSALAAWLHRTGHDVRVLIPRYSRIDESGIAIEPVKELADMRLRLGSREQTFAIDRATLPGTDLPIYLLRCPEFYHRPGIYTQDDDEHLRFLLLQRAAIEMCQRMKFAPDIFHCHDWQTSLIPLYLRSTYAWDKLFAKTRTVLTIHNIGYQGMFPAYVLPELQLTGAEHHLHQDDLKNGVINFLKTGVMYADLITTVSPTYSREILGDDYGMGLNHLLRARVDSVVGILNGVDYDEWNPETDPLIPQNYTPANIRGKVTCKKALMREMGLEYAKQRPLAGLISRLVGQKGIDLIQNVVPTLLRSRDFALVVLGSGEPRYENFFSELQRHFPGRVCYYRGFSNKLAHWIEAGSDIFLMPSLYEPCGLNQMYSLKYGTVPIVRETGGLADSVQQIDPDKKSGTGILFRDYNEAGLAWAMNMALDLYDRRPLWRKIVANGMAMDYSWERQGGRYVELFRQLSNEQ
ncbi:MAG: glycogen synthase GlgA [Gammaproteobacteria bacterium]|nr:glycogen synthase GlgA [Gammaproteobacteria bacterium]